MLFLCNALTMMHESTLDFLPLANSLQKLREINLEIQRLRCLTLTEDHQVGLNIHLSYLINFVAHIASFTTVMLNLSFIQHFEDTHKQTGTRQARKGTDANGPEVVYKNTCNEINLTLSRDFVFMLPHYITSFVDKAIFRSIVFHCRGPCIQVS